MSTNVNDRVRGGKRLHGGLNAGGISPCDVERLLQLGFLKIRNCDRIRRTNPDTLKSRTIKGERHRAPQI